MLFNNIKKKRSTNFRDKLQFVNSMKPLVFDLTKIPILKCLVSTSRLIAEVLDDQNLLPNRIWVIGFPVMSSFIVVERAAAAR